MTDHIKCVKRILCSSGNSQGIDTPPDLVHFISLLLHPDPDERLSAIDALQHEFLTEQINIPVSLLLSSRAPTKVHSNSISTLRKSQDISLKWAAALSTRPSPLPQSKKSPNISAKSLTSPVLYTKGDVPSSPLNFKDYKIPISYASTSSSKLPTSPCSPRVSVIPKTTAVADSLMSVTAPPRSASQQKSTEGKERDGGSSNVRSKKEKELPNSSSRGWGHHGVDDEYDWFDQPVITGKRSRSQVNYAEGDP